VLPNFDADPLSQPVPLATSMHTTNNAHKYLREPPPVKLFPIKYSAATNRKSCRPTISPLACPTGFGGICRAQKMKMERGIPVLTPFHTVKRCPPVFARYGFPLGEF
jgi:hypothetical protein